MINNDKPKCFCGVFGIFGDENAAVRTYYGLHSLQHRGQEAAGIVTSNINAAGNDRFHIERGEGLVGEVFSDLAKMTEKLPGNAAIGHNRYSTTGSKSAKNIQPFYANYRLGNLAIAHNGNLTNAKVIRKELVKEGAIFQTSTDTEVILHLIARSQLEDQVEQVKEALNRVEGAYSLVILTDDKLIAARDPHGFKPFCIGKSGNSFITTSETCALDINNYEYLRDIKPGEIVVIDREVTATGEIKSYSIREDENQKNKHCVFEYIYFSRPDSKIYGSAVDKMRRKLGQNLAKNHPVKDPDGEKVVVMSVPDSSNTAAIGYQKELERMGIPSKYDIGLIRSHYIGRTFILPGQESREMGVRVKFNTVKGVLEGKTLVVIDDSIVRGTTSRLLVKLLREAKPKSIHIRISSPMILHPCFYGMDFPSKEELFANKFEQNLEIMRKELGVDSLEYMEVDEMLEAMVDHSKEDFCTSCFSGFYPVKIDKDFKKEEYDDNS